MRGFRTGCRCNGSGEGVTMNLRETIAAIQPLNVQAAGQAKQRWASIAKPLNSLGLLESALVRIAGMTGDAEIRLHKRAVVVMCADNGVV